MSERLFLSSGNLTVLDTSSLSESGNTARKTLLVSVLDHENLNGVLIGAKEGKKYHSTLVNKPIQAYLKYDEDGRPADFGGHELREKLDADGNRMYYFATQSIGTHIKTWIENRYMEEYGGNVDCILAEVELWTSRYPEYYAVAEKLLEEGKLSSSWEIDTHKYEYVGGKKRLIEFEFIGNALLGSDITPAVSGAGVMTSEVDKVLREAIERDIMVASTEVKKGDCSLENEEKVVIAEEEVVVEETVVVEEDTVLADGEVVEDTVKSVVSEEEVPVEETEASDESVEEIVAEPAPDTASLTMYDIYRKLYLALINSTDKLNEIGVEDAWELESFVHYPLELRAIFNMYWSADKESTMLEVSYEVANDEVTITNMKKVEMVFVEVAELNATKEKVTELSEKLIEMNNELSAKEASLVELSEYKVKIDEIEKAEKEAKKLADMAELKNKYLATKMIAEEEFEKDETISVALAELDENKLKLIIAERIIEGRKPAMQKNELEVSSKEEDEGERLDISSYIGYKRNPSGDSITSFIYNK